MTRTKKLELLNRYRPGVYYRLEKEVPNLVKNPDTATEEEILIYNFLIAKIARLDNNNVSFKKNFSF